MSRLIKRFSERVSVSPGATTTTSSGGTSGEVVYSFCVANKVINSASNGGALCDWTPPAGTQWVQFEVWGGGGAGASSACCSAGSSGGGGGFSRYVDDVVGTSYKICAAGSTAVTPCQTSSNVQGTSGFPSFVTKNGSVVVCANGGDGGLSCCYVGSSNNYCWTFPACVTSCHSKGQFNVQPLKGWFKHAWSCESNAWSMQQPGAFSGQAKWGPGGCAVGEGYAAWTSCCADFPGMGGATPYVYGGGYCCGQWGAGGLVIVSYGVYK